MILLTILLLIFFGLSAVNYHSAPELGDLPPAAGKDVPKVSVLIAARNRARELAENLPKLLASNYPDFEVVVVDDLSTDGTATTLGQLAQQYPGKLRAYGGKAAAAGWSRRAWVSQQLASASQGAILIFADASVEVSPDAIRKTVGFMQGRKLTSLNVLPRQLLKGLAEHALVPFVTYLPYFCIFPLNRSRELGLDWLASGEAAWLAYDRATYAGLGAHSAFRSEALPERSLARAHKSSTDNAPLPVLGSVDLSVRPWRGWPELKAGLSETLPARAGGTSAGRYILGAVVFTVFFLPFPLFLLGFGFTGCVALLLGIRFLARAAFRDDWISVLLHPVGAAMLAYLLLANRSNQVSNRG